MSYGASRARLSGGKRQQTYACIHRGRCAANRRWVLLKYAIVFAIISLLAGALGFTGVAAGAAGIAKVLFGLFLILAVVFLVLAALGVGAARKALH